MRGNGGQNAVYAPLAQLCALRWELSPPGGKGIFFLTQKARVLVKLEVCRAASHRQLESSIPPLGTEISSTGGIQTLYQAAISEVCPVPGKSGTEGQTWISKSWLGTPQRSPQVGAGTEPWQHPPRSLLPLTLALLSLPALWLLEGPVRGQGCALQ